MELLISCHKWLRGMLLVVGGPYLGLTYFLCLLKFFLIPQSWYKFHGIDFGFASLGFLSYVDFKKISSRVMSNLPWMNLFILLVPEIWFSIFKVTLDAASSKVYNFFLN